MLKDPGWAMNGHPESVVLVAGDCLFVCFRWSCFFLCFIGGIRDLKKGYTQASLCALQWGHVSNAVPFMCIKTPAMRTNPLEPQLQCWHALLRKSNQHGPMAVSFFEGLSMERCHTTLKLGVRGVEKVRRLQKSMAPLC